MGLDPEETLKRKNVELCLAACRKALSKQTGFVHFNYEQRYESAPADTIPIRENLSFVLALLRSKLQENIVLAKQLLSKLLCFQKEGLFPLYLHDFPNLAPLSYQLYDLVFLYLIEKGYGVILGEELKQEVKRCLIRAKAWAETASLSFSQKLLLQALKEEPLSPVLKPKLSLEEGIECLIAYQIAKEQDEELLEKVLSNWSCELGLYVASPLLYYEKNQPEITLLHLFMAEFFSHFSKAVLKEHPSHLLASLIYPFEKAKAQEIEPLSKEKGERSFTLFWGNEEVIQSLFVQAKSGNLFWKTEEGRVVLTFELMPEELADHSDVELFLSDTEELDLQIEGGKATLFKLGERLQVATPQGDLTLWFEGKEAKGICHLLKGNRPQQRCTKGRYQFRAFDYLIGVRLLAKGAPVVLTLKIDLSKLDTWLIV